jgi:hypothetical protein
MTRTSQPDRAERDPGTESEVKDWLLASGYEEDIFGVGQFQIPVPNRVPDLSRRNESLVHQLLKASAYQWLLGTDELMPQEVRTEQKLYIALEGLMDALRVRVVGSTFDPKVSQVIEPGRRDVFMDYGFEIVCDVFGKGYSIEIGATSPINLFTPVEEGLSKRAIWVPFPRGASKTNPESLLGTSVNAYEIWFEEDGA